MSNTPTDWEALADQSEIEQLRTEAIASNAQFIAESVTILRQKFEGTILDEPMRQMIAASV